MLKDLLSLFRAVFSAPVDAAALNPPTRSAPPDPPAREPPQALAPVAAKVHTAQYHPPEPDPSAALQEALDLVRARLPLALEGLNPPASASDLARCELALQLALPPAVRTLYLTFNGASELACGLFGGWRWLPVDEARDMALELRAIEQEDPSGGYDAAIALPLLDYEGDVLYVECGRGEDSALYYRDHESPTRERVASSVSGFLREFSARVLSGALVFSTFESPGGKCCFCSPERRSYWPPDFDARGGG